MVTDTNVVGESSEEYPCVCLRTKLHCPKCGRASYYWVKSLDLTQQLQAGGGQRIDKGFRCTKCGTAFRNSSVCTAPRLELSSKNQELADAVREQAEDRSDEAKEQRRRVVASLRALGRHQQAELAEKNLREKGLI